MDQTKRNELNERDAIRKVLASKDNTFLAECLLEMIGVYSRELQESDLLTLEEVANRLKKK